MSSDEPDERPTVETYERLLSELVVAYAEHLAMQGRFATLAAELRRIHDELSIIDAELDVAGWPTVATSAPVFADKDRLLDQLMSVSEASSAETTVYVTEMLPRLHTLLLRVQRRSQS